MIAPAASGASAPAARITIDIWSDVMCPWCIIGYRNLETALAGLAGEIEAELRWLPFELNPDMPPEGEESLAHIARKYGRTLEQAAAGREQLRLVGARAGYRFAYAGNAVPEPPAMLWNTQLAHRLLKWTLAEHGAAAQTRLKLALFDAHFQQRRRVGEAAVLAEIAAEAGLDRTAAAAAMADEALGVMVRQEQRLAWDMNVTGVPTMVVNGQFLIPGAQDPETYATALRRVVAKASSAPPNAESA